MNKFQDLGNREITAGGKWGLAGFFLASGMAVFFLGGYFTGFSPLIRTVFKAGLPVLFLGITLVFRRHDHWRRYWRLSFAFFAASLGFLVAWLFSDALVSLLNISSQTMAGLALTKLVDAVLIILPILVVVALVEGNQGGLYIRGGRLRTSLWIGGASFLILAVVFYCLARQQGIGGNQLLRWSPWILVFVLSNAFLEELHFRGLFLSRLARFLGRGWANVLVAVVFTLVHVPVEYTPDIIPFLAVLFVLALLWGALIQRTQSLWGAVLFHAGADLLIIIEILNGFRRS